jgi:HK97 family phage major capsid protein
MDERLKEIEARKLEILSLLKSEAEVDSDALNAEFKTLETEEVEARATIAEDTRKSAEEETRKAEEAEEQRKLEVAKAEEVALAEKRNLAKEGKLEGKEIEEKEMAERNYNYSSPEYTNVWAKRMMGLELNAEERAVGDAVSTTATTFTGADSTHVGVNNAGLLIPEQVQLDMLKIWEDESPFFRDIKKLAVAGNISLPYLYAADDAAWQTEAVNTKNEGQEFREITLTGHELAKAVVITWKVEKMAVAAFIPFITAELAAKMGKAIMTAAWYGTGSGQPTGALLGLSATTGGDPIAAIVASYKALSADMRKGAKVYISTDIEADIIGDADGNGNYPFLAGLPRVSNLTVEVDPFLAAADIAVGNPQNYIWNFVEPVSIDAEKTVIGRKTTYAAYAIADGKPYPGAFTKGGVVVVSA